MDRKAELEISIAGLTAGMIGPQIALQDGFQKVLTEAISNAAILQNLKVQEYNLTVKQLSDLHRDQENLRDSLFTAANLPAAPDQTWGAFISSGQEYRRHLESLGAHDDSRCLYCRQLLNDEAARLIARYSDYLESQIAADIQDQMAALKQLAKPFQDFSLAAVQTYIQDVDGGINKALQSPPDRIEVLRNIVNLNAGLQQKLTDGVPIDENLLAGVSGIRAVVEPWLSEVKETLKELRNQDSDLEKSLKDKEDELIELKARFELC